MLTVPFFRFNRRVRGVLVVISTCLNAVIGASVVSEQPVISLVLLALRAGIGKLLEISTTAVPLPTPKP